MKKLTSSLFLIGGLVLSGCASQTNWTPTVDGANDPNAYNINQDMAECKQLASQSSGGTGKKAAIGAGVGGGGRGCWWCDSGCFYWQPRRRRCYWRSSRWFWRRNPTRF
ncbi:exported hypothetical protein [Crenothrix polyspora]|uniref:Lipoprotein n=1 Tax=Crenothrix polyspora TaxID=360316 RepID=A0A1R4H283_9GAMM|nr:exported hypothetical protein [Crenothrix polyspora]